MVGEWPVRLVDTAGMRSSDDLVERLGIEVSERYVKDADVSMVCSDGSGATPDDGAKEYATSAAATTHLCRNKAGRTPERTDSQMALSRKRGDRCWVG